jgi:hypothetical protein
MQNNTRTLSPYAPASTWRRNALVVAVLLVIGVLMAACDVHGVSEPGTLASITVTPNATLAASTTQQMVAVGHDADGRVVEISPSWSVTASGGTINSAGIFTAGGTTGFFANTVRATVGDISGTASITVTPGALASISIVPNPVTLAVTATQQFVAVGKDAGGNIVQFTPTWTVVAGGGTIAQTGMFTAGNTAGTFTNTVQVSSLGLTAFATVNVTIGPLASITVTPNPATLIVGAVQQFTATGRDAGGNAVALAAVWTVAAGGGTIDGGGRFTAGNTPGTFTNTIVATSGTLTGRATVIVTAGPLATITVTPNPATMAINGTQQFTAVGADVGGNPVSITPVVWSVVAGGGTINGVTGLFTAGTLTGTFTNTVRATSGTVSGSATVIVTSGPLATITVTPNPVFMAMNATQQFVAVGRDASGNVFIITPTWSVVNGGGTINAGGVFTAGAVAGTFANTVQATSGTISGNATVTVNPALSLATITVSPNPATVVANGTQQFTAVGRDQNGNIFAFAPTWAVDNGGGAINSSTGLFTAGAVAGTFFNTVRAFSGAISGRATVTVTAVVPPPPLSPLGSAANFGILAGTGINCAISGTINGSNSNIGSSPTATVGGFPPCTFTGSIPLPAVVATAKGDLTAAYLAAQAQVCNPLPFPAGNNLSGIDLGFFGPANPLPPGTYCFSTTAGITGTLQLNGSAAAVWTFQIGSALTTAVASQVLMGGGAIPDNVYWAVGSSATLGTSSVLRGNIMALASITLNNGATLLGRALAQNGAVDLIQGAATITKP